MYGIWVSFAPLCCDVAYYHYFHIHLEVGLHSKQLSKEQAYKIYGCSRSILTDWLRRYRETGTCRAMPNTGRPKKLSEEQQTAIIKLLEEQSDITLEEIRDKLNLAVTVSTIYYYLQRLGFTYKKNSTRQRTRQRRCCNSTQ